MSKDPPIQPSRVEISKLCLFVSHDVYLEGIEVITGLQPKEMVEPDGIEPTTSCLQSRRSPS